MKTRTLASLCAAAALILSGFPAKAQEPVTTGTIQGVVPPAGMLTLRSDQTTRPVTFYGMERANIFSVDGVPMAVEDLAPGMRATVQYAAQGKRWLISKVIIEEQAPSVIIGPTIIEYPASRSPAAYDGDITTRPAGQAAFDGDITTRPASPPHLPVRRRGP